MSTEIVEIPALLEIKPFPALGSGNYNQEAYDHGISLPPAVERAREIVEAGRTNALAAKEQAEAAKQAREGAVSDITAIKNTAVEQTGALARDAREYRDAAAVSALAAQSSANFKGDWAALSGALAPPATVRHTGKFWVMLTAVANVAAAEPSQASVVWADASGGVPRLEYEQRSTLRTTHASTGGQAVVDGLGLFVFDAASDEPDDDESCFVTSSGAWLLECPHWDVVDTWRLPDDDARDGRLDDLELRVISGSAMSSITSVASVAQVSFAADVPGALPGDIAIATPPDALGPRISHFAAVTAANAVTVYLNNPSAAAQTLVAGEWTLAVIKK